MSAPQGDGPALLAGLESFLTRYASLPPGMALVLGLYSAMTHCFERFDALPYLAVTSPTKGCGKTRALELLSMLCARPRSTVGVTPAALFRVTDKEKPTLFVDESESLSGKSEKSEAIREIANAGYKRGLTVMRCEPRKGGKYELKHFDVFSPKVFALIGRLPATLTDRSIEIRMQRSRRRLARYRRANVEPEGRGLHDQIKAWVAAHKEEIKGWYLGHDLDSLDGRNEELWLPLFAVCHVMAPERTRELETIACECAGRKQADDSDEVALNLLRDIRAIFQACPNDEAPSAELCEVLNANSELPYITWNIGQGIRPHDLARRLHPFGVRPRNLRLGEQVRKGYARKDFEAAWEGYLPSLPAPDSRYTATRGENTGRNEDLGSATESPRSGAENLISAN
jgi:hypothetical protein